MNRKENILETDQLLVNYCPHFSNMCGCCAFKSGNVPLAECLDQRRDCRSVLCSRELSGNFDELVSYSTLCRYDNCQFITGFVVLLKDIHYAFDALGIGNRCPAKFH